METMTFATRELAQEWLRRRGYEAAPTKGANRQTRQYGRDDRLAVIIEPLDGGEIRVEISDRSHGAMLPPLRCLQRAGRL
jgi:membrane protein implicated in regulation of membrane protease activity